MKQILIIQAQMKQYRVPFFDGLRATLEKQNVRLKVAYSAPTKEEVQKGDNPDLSPEYGIKVKGYWFFGNRVLYQPLLREILRADLIIVEQANKFLLNHFLIPLSSLHLKKIAFWGLGENRQKDRSWLSEWYKRLVIGRADWWFAYTSGVAAYVASRGVSTERVTAVQNSVDTTELQKLISHVSDSAIQEARRRLGIGSENRVGIYCGSLDRVKGIPFLLTAARLVHQKLPNFHLIVAGGGPDRPLVEEMSRTEAWVHYAGPSFGFEKALLLKLSDVMLQPGRIGLVVLDAFAAGLPLLTIRLPIHGPEAEYLKNKTNGMLTEPVETEYADAVVTVLTNPELLERWREAARESAKRYSIEAMVQNFQMGILNCLPSRTIVQDGPQAPERFVVGRNERFDNY